MCGIVGDWNKQGEAKTQIYKCMAMQIRHRGPDDSCVWLDEEPGLGLAHQRLAVLIGDFGILVKRFPDWFLSVVGEGGERWSLIEQVAAMNLGGRVVLHGATDDIKAEYLEADLFVISTQLEGFPNALAEAMAHGLPTVGFADCPGVNELIQHGSNGLLALENGDKETLPTPCRS